MKCKCGQQMAEMFWDHNTDSNWYRCQGLDGCGAIVHYEHDARCDCAILTEYMPGSPEYVAYDFYCVGTG